MLRLGNNTDLELDIVYFSPGMDDVVEVKEKFKDLGIYVDENLSYE